MESFTVIMFLLTWIAIRLAVHVKASLATTLSIPFSSYLILLLSKLGLAQDLLTAAAARISVVLAGIFDHLLAPTLDPIRDFFNDEPNCLSGLLVVVFVTLYIIFKVTAGYNVQLAPFLDMPINGVIGSFCRFSTFGLWKPQYIPVAQITVEWFNHSQDKGTTSDKTSSDEQLGSPIELPKMTREELELKMLEESTPLFLWDSMFPGREPPAEKIAAVPTPLRITAWSEQFLEDEDEDEDEQPEQAAEASMPAPAATSLTTTAGTTTVPATMAPATIAPVTSSVVAPSPAFPSASLAVPVHGTTTPTTTPPATTALATSAAATSLLASTFPASPASVLAAPAPAATAPASSVAATSSWASVSPAFPASVFATTAGVTTSPASSVPGTPSAASTGTASPLPATPTPAPRRPTSGSSVLANAAARPLTMPASWFSVAPAAPKQQALAPKEPVAKTIPAEPKRTSFVPAAAQKTPATPQQPPAYAPKTEAQAPKESAAEEARAAPTVNGARSSPSFTTKKLPDGRVVRFEKVDRTGLPGRQPTVTHPTSPLVIFGNFLQPAPSTTPVGSPMPAPAPKITGSGSSRKFTTTQLGPNRTVKFEVVDRSLLPGRMPTIPFPGSPLMIYGNFLGPGNPWDDIDTHVT